MKKNSNFFGLVLAFLFLLGNNNSFADGFNSVHTPDGVYVIAAGDAGKIFRSVNGGNTWASYNESTVNFKSVFTLGTNVWLAADNGNIYKSSTSSITLSPYTTGLSSSINSVYFIDASNGFACGDNGVVLKSVNGGLSWTPSNSGISSEKLNSISFKDALNGVVAGNNGKVYTTANGGSSWTPEAVSTTKNLFEAKYFSDGIGVTGEWGTLLIKQTGNPWTSVATRINTDIKGISGTSVTDMHVCGGGGFIRNNKNSSPLFLNFEKNPMLANLVDMVYYNSNIGFAVSSLNNAIIRTVNGGSTWELPSGTTVSYNWVAKPGASGNFLGNNLCLHPTDRNTVFIAFGNQIYRSKDKGEAWTSISTIPTGNTPHSFFVSPLDTNIWLVATEGSPDKIYRTTNFGATWTAVGPNLNFSNYGQPLEMDQNNPHVFYFAPDNGGFYKSTDDGATFTEISHAYPFRSPCDIIIMWDNPNTIFLADGITGSGSATLYKSVNGGVNWVLVQTNTTSSEIPSMCNSVFDQSTFWHTEWSGGNIYKSTDYGDTWSLQHTNSFSGWGSDICHEDPNVVITGSWGNAASLTLDGGTTWTPISSGLSGHGGGILVPERGYILCHQGSNVYKLNIIYTVITSIGENNLSSIPKSFNLAQNYPNPFNPTTKIMYDLPKSGNVVLKVYNETGKEVSTLVNAFRNAGTYEITLDASGFTSGIYFYKLESEGLVSTKKMLLIK